MTIKDVEQLLEIPRATVRFYEKEGLINPGRAENGYRDYSDEDIEKLRKIIVLRKIGVNVNDISDLFDGAKSMQQILDDNIVNLQNQLNELNGALKLTSKMKDDQVEMETFNAESYINIIFEEEKKGNSFMSIAKDIAKIEKNVILSHFSSTDINGEPYADTPHIILNAIIITIVYGSVNCFTKKQWNIRNFISGLWLFIGIIIIETVINIIVYFLGRKWPWFKKNKKKTAGLLYFLLTLTLILLVMIL